MNEIIYSCIEFHLELCVSFDYTNVSPQQQYPASFYQHFDTSDRNSTPESFGLDAHKIKLGILHISHGTPLQVCVFTIDNSWIKKKFKLIIKTLNTFLSATSVKIP